MDIIIGASLIAAFIAGIAALFAPCCITVLLPSYFGSIFREKRKVFLMTFIFFLGILTVFLPLGLGVSVLGQIFSRYHQIIFSVASIFFLLLGITLIAGKRVSLPFNVHPKIEKYDYLSIFILGIFSGIATTCCAPVLAGVIALSILPGSVIWGLIYTLAYVLGMVSPLFLIAFFLDRINLTEKFLAKAAPRKFTFLGMTSEITIPELISGITFLAIGVLTGIWAFMKDTGSSELQVSINIYMANLQVWLNGFIGGIPQYFWAILFVGILVFLIAVAIKQFKKYK